MASLYKVIKPFTLSGDDTYDWANSNVYDYKVGDIVKVDDSGGQYMIPLAYNTGNTNFWGKSIWALMYFPVSRDNLQFVKVCSNYRGRYRNLVPDPNMDMGECISPNATVIDNALLAQLYSAAASATTTAAQATSTGLGGWIKNHKAASAGIGIAIAAAIGFTIYKIKKKK